MKTSQSSKYISILCGVAAVTLALTTGCSVKTNLEPIDPKFPTPPPGEDHGQQGQLPKPVLPACADQYSPIQVPLEEPAKEIFFKDLPAGANLAYDGAEYFVRATDPSGKSSRIHVRETTNESRGYSTALVCATPSSENQNDDLKPSMLANYGIDEKGSTKLRARQFSIHATSTQVDFSASWDETVDETTDPMMLLMMWEGHLYQVSADQLELRATMKMGTEGSASLEQVMLVRYKYSGPSLP